MPLTILADDLTGACDTGALFGGRGPVAVTVSPASPATTREVLVLDTESRSLPPPLAARRVEEALAALPAARRGGRVFKKIDSTLRGSVGAEVEAILSAARTPRALVCPAFPAQGRVVVNRILTAHGRPVHETAIGRDPDFPAATSDVLEILRRQAARPVHWLSLAETRQPPDALAAALSRTDEALVVADAETDADLERLADAALAAAPVPLLAGSAGLARAAAARLGYAGATPPLPGGVAWLIVAGSLNPATQAQLRALEQARVEGARLDQELSVPDGTLAAMKNALTASRTVFLAATAPARLPDPVERRRTATAIAQVVSLILKDAVPHLLVLVGGETAIAVYQELKAGLIEVAGAPAPGLALGHLRGGAVDGCRLLTKAGGFGPPDLFLSLLGRSAA